MIIVVVMGAGVITVFVKSDTSTTPTAGPSLAPSSSVAETIAPTPTSTAEASKPLAARNGVRKSEDEVAKLPHLPASGVGGHPFGIVLVAFGCAIALWVRRAARA